MNKWQIEGKSMPERWSHRAPDSSGKAQLSIHPHSKKGNRKDTEEDDA